MRALHYAIALCGLVVLLHGGVLAQEASRDNFLVEQGVARRPESYAAGTVVLSNRFGRVEISRYAAQVLSYVPAGGREVFYMPDDRDFSKTREMHGGVPLCWPCFNMSGEPFSSQHGFARYSNWRVVEEYSDDDLSRAVLELVSTPETKRIWPFDFRLAYTVTLTDRLVLDLRTVNTADPRTASGKWFELTQGFHAYFNVSDPKGVTVAGVMGADGACTTVRGASPLSHTSPVVSGEYTLDDPGSSRSIAVATRGATDLVLWNPGGEPLKSRSNRTPGDEGRFLCVEPVVLRERGAVRVCPGCETRLQMSVREVRHDVR